MSGGQADRMSAVWKQFTRVEGEHKATCNSCGKVLTVTGGKTPSGLKNHLANKHKDLFKQYEEETAATKTSSQKRPTEADAAKSDPKQRKIEDCFPESQENLNKAIDDAIVDFLADTGVAFNVVGKASFDRLMKIANKRINLKHPTTYSRLMKVKAAEIKQDIMDIVGAVKGDLVCAGFTTDMWTSSAGDPFMSLTLHFIDKNWRLHRWTPYVAPFPASHTGKNISLGLDAMVEELGLDGPQWELFSVNDNAANVKLGIKMSHHLKQYLCDIHTLELAIKDTFKNTPGVKALRKKTRALAKFTKKSPTVAGKQLRREADKENIAFRKLANPPNTRWSGELNNFTSVLHLKKPLMNLMSRKENWHPYALTPAEWKLLESAVKLLKSVKDTIEALEAEKTPTMHRVLERLYTMHCTIDDFTSDPVNSRNGVGFARELKKQIEKRFPRQGTEKKLPCMANYLAPQFKGDHLLEENKLEVTKRHIEEEVNKINNEEAQIEIEPDNFADNPPLEESVELSPNSKLKRKLMRLRTNQQRPNTVFRNDEFSAARKEMKRYETFSYAHKGVDILEWWKSHEKVLPNLSKVAKKVLTVPASSAKSEKVFSTGGNFVTKKRNRLGVKKVEELIVVKENKSQIEDFKTNGGYEIKRSNTNAFQNIIVDQVLADILQEEIDDDEESDCFDSESENETEVLYEIEDEDETRLMKVLRTN